MQFLYRFHRVEKCDLCTFAIFTASNRYRTARRDHRCRSLTLGLRPLHCGILLVVGLARGGSQWPALLFLLLCRQWAVQLCSFVYLIGQHVYRFIPYAADWLRYNDHCSHQVHLCSPTCGGAVAPAALRRTNVGQNRLLVVFCRHQAVCRPHRFPDFCFAGLTGDILPQRQHHRR